MKQPYDPSLLTRIKNKMISQQLTLSVAESVTAGNLQVALSQSEGATQFFQGGITTYNIGQKSRHLNVDPIYALKCNCVDELITGQMALQANQLFLSSYAIGITGYAVK